MDRSVLSLIFKNFSHKKAEKCADEMLSDFQRMYFARYYATALPLLTSAVFRLLCGLDDRLKTIMIGRTDM